MAMVFSAAPHVPLEETRQALLERSRRFGSVPGEILIEHVLRTATGGDFAVHEAAADALRRRWEFALRDGLRVTSRPNGRGVLGAYTT